MKLCFIGGEDIRKRESIDLNKKVFRDAGQAPTVLIFPWTFEIEKTAYRDVMINYFKDVGANKIEFAELSDSSQNIKEKIERSDLIYLPGGDDRILINRLKERKLRSLLKNYKGVIVGNSAGALAICKRYVVIKGQEGEPKTAAKAGIGLVNFAVAVHYGSTNPEFLGESPDEELKAFSKKTDIQVYAIPERCALVYEDGKLNRIGDVYIFDKGKKTRM